MERAHHPDFGDLLRGDCHLGRVAGVQIGDSAVADGGLFARRRVAFGFALLAEIARVGNPESVPLNEAFSQNLQPFFAMK